MQCNATTEWWQVLTQTGVLLVYLQRDVISAGQTLTHGGEGHLLDVPDALVDAVDGLVTLPLPRGLVPVTTEEMSLLQGCRGVFFSLQELDFSIQSRYCTLQYHKSGESVQMWVFLLTHTHTHRAGWAPVLIGWSGRTVCGGQPDGQQAEPLFLLLLRVLQSRRHRHWSQIRSSVCSLCRSVVWSVFSLLTLHQSTSVLSVERETQSHLSQNTTQWHQTQSVISTVFKTILQKTTNLL